MKCLCTLVSVGECLQPPQIPVVQASCAALHCTAKVRLAPLSRSEQTRKTEVNLLHNSCFCADQLPSHRAQVGAGVTQRCLQAVGGLGALTAVGLLALGALAFATQALAIFSAITANADVNGGLQRGQTRHELGANLSVAVGQAAARVLVFASSSHGM